MRTKAKNDDRKMKRTSTNTSTIKARRECFGSTHSRLEILAGLGVKPNCRQAQMLTSSLFEQDKMEDCGSTN